MNPLTKMYWEYLKSKNGLELEYVPSVLPSYGAYRLLIDDTSKPRNI